MATDIMKWLEQWCTTQADGEWEHSFGVRIQTVDNPGWWISIDLEDTEYEDVFYDAPTVEISETDWYFYRFEKKKFDASGDLTKLEFLLCKFRETIEAFKSKKASG